MKSKINNFTALAGPLTIIVLALAACQPSAAIKEKVSQGLASIIETNERDSYLPDNLVNLGTEKLPKSDALSLTEQLLASGSRYAYIRSDLGKVSSAENTAAFLPGALVNIHSNILPEVVEGSAARSSAESVSADNILSSIIDQQLLVKSDKEDTQIAQTSVEMVNALQVEIPESIYPDHLPEYIKRRIEVFKADNLETLQAASEIVTIPEAFLPEWVKVRVEVDELAKSEMMQVAIPHEFLPEWVNQRVEIAEKANLEKMQSASRLVTIPPELLPEWVKQRVETAEEVVSEMLPETINLVNLGQEKLPRSESFSLTEMLISSGSRYAYVRSDMVIPRADAISVAESLPSFLPRGLVNLGIERLPRFGPYSLTEQLMVANNRYAYVRSESISPVSDSISVAQERPSWLPSGLVNFLTEDLPLEDGELLPCPTATC